MVEACIAIYLLVELINDMKVISLVLQYIVVVRERGYTIASTGTVGGETYCRGKYEICFCSSGGQIF